MTTQKDFEKKQQNSFSSVTHRIELALYKYKHSLLLQRLRNTFAEHKHKLFHQHLFALNHKIAKESNLGAHACDPQTVQKANFSIKISKIIRLIGFCVKRKKKLSIFMFTSSSVLVIFCPFSSILKMKEASLSLKNSYKKSRDEIYLNDFVGFSFDLVPHMLCGNYKHLLCDTRFVERKIDVEVFEIPRREHFSLHNAKKII